MREGAGDAAPEVKCLGCLPAAAANVRHSRKRKGKREEWGTGTESTSLANPPSPPGETERGLIPPPTGAGAVTLSPAFLEKGEQESHDTGPKQAVGGGGVQVSLPVLPRPHVTSTCSFRLCPHWGPLGPAPIIPKWPVVIHDSFFNLNPLLLLSP